MNSNERHEFILKNKLRYYSLQKVIEKCFDTNINDSNLAIDELIERNPLELPINNKIASSIVDKMTIEQIYKLISLNIDTPLCHLAYPKLKAILTYYEKNNPDYYKKIMEDESEYEYVKAKKSFKVIKGNKK